MRRGELCALTWDDVDFKEGTIKIDKSKYAKKGKTAIKAPKTTAGIRTILIGENVAKELKKAHNEYLKNKLAMGMAFKDSNHVISKADGSSYHPDSLTKKWERFEAKHNLKHIRFHDLRVYFASISAAMGIPEIYTSHHGGWKEGSKVLHEHYQKPIATFDEVYSNKLNDYFESMTQNMTRK